MNPIYMLHFASFTPNMGPYQEFNAAPEHQTGWFEPALVVQDGLLQVPDGPGLGVTIDPAILKRAKRI
jgi:L-alanine-DL-glutamate epimerase-like enolase superfamily enzyme